MKELGISDLMLRAFVECLVLVGIHAYLGLHVIRRKVIFVDLALAQVAALGTTVGFLFGMAPNSTAALLFSMLFTFAAAALFAITRTSEKKVPHEAIIGVVYAVAAAVIILVVDRAPHGAEHIKEVMTGSILWVTWSEIGLAAAVYSLVGCFHFVFRRPILAISEDPQAAREAGIRVWVWDFAFYLTFGVVIAISVRTAGVLLVFVFLVVPAIIASMFTDKLKTQLFIGWGMGLLVTVLGLGISYFADMPTGPSVVAFYGLVLGGAAVVIYLLRSATWPKALARLAAGLGVFASIAGLIWFAGWSLAKSSLARSSHQHRHVDVHAEDHGTADDAPPVTSANADECNLGELTHGKLDSTELTKLEKALERADDDELRLSYSLHIACHNRLRGAEHLINLLEKSEMPFILAEAFEALQKIAKRKFDYDPERTQAENAAGLKAIKDWLKEKLTEKDDR